MISSGASLDTRSGDYLDTQRTIIGGLSAKKVRRCHIFRGIYNLCSTLVSYNYVCTCNAHQSTPFFISTVQHIQYPVAISIASFWNITANLADCSIIHFRVGLKVCKTVTPLRQLKEERRERRERRELSFSLCCCLSLSSSFHLSSGKAQH
jgi:hypothetical protein